MAELRKQALLASGVQIEGLQQPSGNGAPSGPKKVVYGNRKKKGPATKDADAPESRPMTPEVKSVPLPPPSLSPSPSPVPQQKPKSVANDEPKDDWDASSDEEEVKASKDVKDSWDASSEDEDSAPAPVPAAPSTKTPASKKSTPAPAPAKTNQKGELLIPSS